MFPRPPCSRGLSCYNSRNSHQEQFKVNGRMLADSAKIKCYVVDKLSGHVEGWLAELQCPQMVVSNHWTGLLGKSKLCSFFNLLCYALIPELSPIMLLKMCLLFLNYAAINFTNQRELHCKMEAST